MDSSSEEAGKMSWAEECVSLWHMKFQRREIVGSREAIAKAVNDALEKAAQVADDSCCTSSADCDRSASARIRALMEPKP